MAHRQHISKTHHLLQSSGLANKCLKSLCRYRIWLKMSGPYLCCWSVIKQQELGHSSWATFGLKAVFGLVRSSEFIASHFWHLVIRKGSNQWAWVITVKKVGGSIETEGVVIFNLASLHPWWVCNSWRPWSPYNIYINYRAWRQTKAIVNNGFLWETERSCLVRPTRNQPSTMTAPTPQHC